jgi:molecular chaperone DnaK
MARTKIDYGIDLGTTNSAVARIENGQPVIKKTDIQMDTMPSCIGFNKKQIVRAGEEAARDLKSDKLRAMMNFKADSYNTFIEFKRTMGTDKKYISSNMNRQYSSEELSAEVLKKLKSFITDDELKAIVITVPAKFTINQKDATVRAAKLAGFEHCELLQEPIAASMSYGLDSVGKDGLWLVFDFGGGTFDAALLRVEEGIMKVIDTEGDNYLGGKNLDYAIVDEIILPYLEENFAINSILEDSVKKEVLREAMKYYAEEAKIQLSFKATHNILPDLGAIPGVDDEGNEFELDITLSQSEIAKTVGPIFQKAVDICKGLLQRNNLSGNKLDALILVGGPTYSPVLRQMLKEQITEKVDTSVDPMTAVARGAALFASTLNVSADIVDRNRDKTKVQLSLGYESTTVEVEEFVTVKVLTDKTTGKVPDKLFVDIVRGDKAWSTGKVAVDEVGEVIDVKLISGKSNAFIVSLYNEFGDLMPCEPSEFTIIQGFAGGNATLPYSIGIEVKDRISGRTGFSPVRGLEKNQTLPAIGTATGLKTQKLIRPGLQEDFIVIPIYQGEYDAEGSKAIYNEHVYDAIITGEDLPSILPEGSEVELTLKADRSEKMVFIAHFPVLNFTQEIVVPTATLQKEVNADWLKDKIAEARQVLDTVREEGHYNNTEELEKLTTELDEFEKLLDQNSTDYDRKKQILNNLRTSLRKLDEVQDAGEWPRLEQELKETFYLVEGLFAEIEGTVEELNEDRAREALADFKRQIPQIIREKNMKVAAELIEQMKKFEFALTDTAMGVQMELSFLQRFHQDFNEYGWTNPGKARTLINQALQLAANNPSKQQLRPILSELVKLLPDDERSEIGSNLLVK